ncbi:MAG: hypothetical protein Q4F95_14885 [Oscillospiraceae bacterium]|nr:hypothetical protein [Oscillospiraceae bacterium]
MTAEFAAKMIMAKKLEFEAVKSVMPERIKKLADRAESKTIKFCTEVAACILSQEKSHNQDTKQTKKVTIE